MNTSEKILEYLKPLPLHKTTISKIAFSLGVSSVGVAKSVRDLEIAGKLRVVDRKRGDWTIYEVLSV